VDLIKGDLDPGIFMLALELVPLAPPPFFLAPAGSPLIRLNLAQLQRLHPVLGPPFPGLTAWRSQSSPGLGATSWMRASARIPRLSTSFWRTRQTVWAGVVSPKQTGAEVVQGLSNVRFLHDRGSREIIGPKGENQCQDNQASD
jgi:hypothetical protein